MRNAPIARLFCTSRLSFGKYGILPYNCVFKEIIVPAATSSLKTSPASTSRLEARISTDLHSALKRAAEIQGRTMTDFVVAAVQEAAQKAIAQAAFIHLTVADQEAFANALIVPPKPNAALKRAFKRRRQLLRAE